MGTKFVGSSIQGKKWEGDTLRICNNIRTLTRLGVQCMVGVERKKHLPKNETIPIKTLFHINALDASIFI